MQEQQVEKVTYLSWEELQQPNQEIIAQGSIDTGFASTEWFIQFQTITHLRQANKFYSHLFLNELLPKNVKQMIAQVDNLRSNNSKQALTLLGQIIENQNLVDVEDNITRPIVAALMVKSVSQKGFLKAQALKALGFLPLKWNQGAFEELCEQTHATNGQISELAIKLVAEMLQNKKDYQINGIFLKNLSLNLNGKRAVVQKKAKEILKDLKNREGQEVLELKITKSTELLEEETNTLRRELKEKETKPKAPSLKDFLKAKKLQS